MRQLFPLLLLLLCLGCSHKAVVVSAPPPVVSAGNTSSPGTTSRHREAAKLPSSEPEMIEISPEAKPLLVETGIASWYGAPYHNRRGSNGEIYDMHGMTAAHRTLPLGSIVRVTEIANGKAVLVRITDRGPFIEGRIIDLSQAAAAKLGVIQEGTAKVRVELLKSPASLEGKGSGRWAVQIGAFEEEQSAREIAGRLSRRYHTAKVLTFNSPVGDWWVRVRVKGDMRARAEEVIRDAKMGEGAIFLVRLD